MRIPGTHAFVHHVLAYCLMTILVGGWFGLTSVWMRHQISLAANDNRIVEAQINELERHSEEVRTAIAEEQDVSVLLRRNEEWHLGMVPPRQDQIQAVNEDPMARLAAKRNRDIFPAGVEAVSFHLAWQH